MIAIPYKYSQKSGISKSPKRITAILRTSNLQQSLILRIRIANITLNTRSGGSRIDGRKSVDSPGENKPKGRKNDKKSFDFSRAAKKNIPIFNNGQGRRGNNDI
jgi:hypothetical protein